VVCYKGNPVSFWLAKKLVNVKYISLVNLIMDKEIVTELIQDELNKKNLIAELNKILTEGSSLNTMKKEYQQLWQKLGSKPASSVAASAIIAIINP